MTIIHADCVEAMQGMEPESIDAIVCDPPYGLEFMGKEWDRLGDVGKTSHAGPSERDPSTPYGRTRVAFSGSSNVKCRACGKWQWDHIGRKCECERPDFPSVKAHQGRLMGDWHARWAEAAYRVAKPSAYLLAFGGTRTVHRMTVALEDAGWIIRDMLVWAYASGFPKSKASLKPAWEPIVMARKPGPLRDLRIDECRIPMTASDAATIDAKHAGMDVDAYQRAPGTSLQLSTDPLPLKAAAAHEAGRWPANVILTDAIFDGGVEGVVGGGEQRTHPGTMRNDATPSGFMGDTVRRAGTVLSQDDTGTYSRFFLIPKAARSDREPVLGGLEEKERSDQSNWYQKCAECGERFVDPTTGQPRCGHDKRQWVAGSKRQNVHPTVKPTELMRHLVRLVTPPGGLVLDPFLGSGTTALACELEGFPWIGIEREAEYVRIAEARLNGTQRGLGLDVDAPTKKRTLSSDEKLSKLAETYPRAGFMPDFRESEDVA